MSGKDECLREKKYEATHTESCFISTFNREAKAQES